jgi:hypothetical protein
MSLRRTIPAVLAAGLLVTLAPAPQASAQQLLCESDQGLAYATYMANAVNSAAINSRNVSIGFYDRTTGTTCFTQPFQRFKTASIVKVLVAVALHLRAQLEERDLDQRERDLLRPMITESSNDATRVLWRELHTEGTYLNQAIAVVGLVDTTPGADGFFGDTVTTAFDQITLMKFLTAPDDEAFLERPRREEILDLMSQVVLTQRYGVPIGAPFGTTWHNKIGFGNLGEGYFDYRTHSIGAIRGPAWNGSQHDYVMALLSEDNLLYQGIARVSAAAVILNQAKHTLPG